MELHLIAFVFLLSCASSFGQYLGEIGCHTDARGIGCVERKRCTVTCPSSCGGEGPAPAIWGTRIYTEDSVLCRSAIHDYRIPKAGSSKTNVTFVRSSFDLKKYLPSIQQGISSAAFGSYSGLFVFNSPYFTEELLDMATLNFMFLYQRNGSFIQSCQIGGRVMITFQFYIPSVTPKRFGVRTPSGWHEVLWSNPQLQPGGYWCNNANNPYSDVMSLAMPSDADFLPEEWTLTASIQENVVIKFNPRQTITTPMNTTWRKDQQVLYSFPNIRQSQNESGYYLEIDKVDVGDAGIYSLEFSNKTEKQGITRLIVRRCTKDHFGPSCEKNCSDCQNGGISHDITGNCICPPGFHGTNCENRCAAGYFGQMCSRSCASSGHAKGSNCKGALICLPDPYGCSCAAGYKGLACDEEITTTSTATTPTTRLTTTTRPVITTTLTSRPTTTTSTMSPQETICQSVTTNQRNVTVILIPSNPCQYGCIESGRKNVIPILKADGELCKNGICVKGVCHETSEKTVCPEDFKGVRSSCKEFCYSVQYTGMSILMNVKDGEFCIEEDHHGLCKNGKCVVL